MNKLEKTRAAFTPGRVITGVGAGLVLAGANAASSMATPVDPVDVITDGATTLNGHVLAIAAAVVGFAAVLMAVRIGWRWVQRFVN